MKVDMPLKNRFLQTGANQQNSITALYSKLHLICTLKDYEFILYIYVLFFTELYFKTYFVYTTRDYDSTILSIKVNQKNVLFFSPQTYSPKLL